MKRIIFMGTPAFAAYILLQLLQAKQDVYEVVAVVSQPDKPIGRKRLLSPTPVKEVAMQFDIPVLQPVKIRDAYDEFVRLEPDLIITAAYGQFVPRNILTLPPEKCINVHGSLLPQYRGGAPIHHAIMNGETQTGITIMYMAEKMDAGAIITQRAIPILPRDTLETMLERLQILGATLLLEMLPALFAHQLQATAQDENRVSYAPTLKKADCKIDWTQSATTIFNHVRGLYPVPTAFTELAGTQIKVYRVRVLHEKTTQVGGTIIAATKTTCHVATGDGIIVLEDLQISGKKRQLIAEIMRGSGRKLFIEGVRFES